MSAKRKGLSWESTNPASCGALRARHHDPKNRLCFRRRRTGANLSTPKKTYTANRERSQEEIPWQTIKTRATTRLVVARRSRMASIAAPNVKEKAVRLNSIVTAGIRSVAETFKLASAILAGRAWLHVLFVLAHDCDATPANVRNSPASLGPVPSSSCLKKTKASRQF